jgi:formate/nitrite transporter FocA (FNT family)
MKQYIKNFLLAIIAGTIISISCITFLSVPDKTIGSILFSAGLLIILNFKLNLFTGKVHCICKNNFKYLIFVITVWLGNFIGTSLAAFTIRYTSIYNKIIITCSELAQAKITDNLISLLILGIFCGVLMCISVEAFNYKKQISTVQANIIIILCISIFIQAGFEHSIADMFYFALAAPIKDWIIPLGVITIGNALGGNIFYFIINL